MKIKISYFYNIRFFNKNEIPVNTAMWPPVWYNENTHNLNHCFIDKRGVFNGITEDSLVFNFKAFDNLDEQCSKACPYINKAPSCKFMNLYREQLSKIDFNGYLIPELTRIAEEVKKITHYEGEPTIVLMVHEKPEISCSERPCL